MLFRFFQTLNAWRHQRRTQAALESLSDRSLRDIGISRSEIAAIAAGVHWPSAEVITLPPRAAPAAPRVAA